MRDWICSRRLPQCSRLGVGRRSKKRVLATEARILQEDTASVAAMIFVNVKGARTHEKNFFVLEAKVLRTEQNAAHKLIGGAESKAKRDLGLAGWIFE